MATIVQYQRILALRSLSSARERGIAFEQCLREALPWDYRPPVALLARSEQLDAFFEWNGWHFLVEAKAKKAAIRAGSHDWEDFELKVRKRHGACIGLFCSLYPVAAGVLTAAEELNRQGMCTIVIHGTLWDRLEETACALADVLRFMVLHARAQFIADPPDPTDIMAWGHELSSTKRKISAVLRSWSATFLRRHRHPMHNDIYVSRGFDHEVKRLAELLRPSCLKSKTKRRGDGETATSSPRAMPPQICILRDASGSGKTTAAVQIALTSSPFLGAARAALEPEIDRLDELFAGLGSARGIDELIAIDMSLVVAVDSLDEAHHVPQKGKQVLSLLRFLEDLNVEAQSRGLRGFPLLLVFTVREEYWEEWASHFEGRSARKFRNRFSEFNVDEFAEALDRYARVYNYDVLCEPSGEAKRVLAVPFNLQVFSEANQYRGPVSLANVLHEELLALYFTRKRDDVFKRQIPGFTPNALMAILSRIAFAAVEQRSNSFARRDLCGLIEGVAGVPAHAAEQIRFAIISEQILTGDADGSDEFRFKHSRFIEYLVACYIAATLDRERTTTQMEDFSDQVFSSGVVSIYRVHDYLRFICRKEFPDVTEALADYYAKSTRFMTGKLQSLRRSLAHGELSAASDVDLVLRAQQNPDAEVAWSAFFVLAAKGNARPDKEILDAFEIAWQGVEGRVDRWKLLQKMSERSLLLEERVLLRTVESRSWREWEALLGCVLEACQADEFRDVWSELARGDILARVELKGDPEWRRVRNLLDIIIHGGEYVRGDGYTEC